MKWVHESNIHTQEMKWNERNCETSNNSSPQKTHNCTHGHTKICLLHQYKITSISSIFATQNQLGLAQGSFPAIIIIIIVSRAGTGSAARSSTATASSPTGTRSCTRRRPPAHPQSGRSSTNSQRNRSSLFQIFKKNTYYYYYCCSRGFTTLTTSSWLATPSSSPPSWTLFLRAPRRYPLSSPMAAGKKFA